MNECFSCGRELRLDGEPIRNVDYVQVGDRKMCVDCWRTAIGRRLSCMELDSIRCIFEAHHFGWMFDEMVEEACADDECHKIVIESVMYDDFSIIAGYLIDYIANEIESLNRNIPRGLARDLIEGDSINKGEEK